MCVRERDREGKVSTSELEPKATLLALHGLAHSTFGIRGGEGWAMVLDLVREVRLN